MFCQTALPREIAISHRTRRLAPYPPGIVAHSRDFPRSFVPFQPSVAWAAATENIRTALIASGSLAPGNPARQNHPNALIAAGLLAPGNPATEHIRRALMSIGMLVPLSPAREHIRRALIASGSLAPENPATGNPGGIWRGRGGGGIGRGRGRGRGGGSHL